MARAGWPLRKLSQDSSLPGRLRRAVRDSAVVRVERLRQRGWQVGQCALAATLAWLLARGLLDHATPFFAPVAAVVALGLNYGNRLSRVLEVVAGVAVGVGVGDLFVSFFGTGPWQIALVVGASMAVAVLVGAGAVLTTQAGVQAVIVTTLLPDPSAGLSRWYDALLGGVVALLVAAVVPATPLVRPRRLAAAAVTEVAELLREAATSAGDGDTERAGRALERARAGQRVLDDLQAAASEGLDVVRISPLRRHHRPGLLRIADLVVPLDRCMHNVRVLLRRVTVTSWREEPVPGATARLMDQLADATEQLSRDLLDGRGRTSAVAKLQAVGEASTALPRSEALAGDVVIAQLRSVVVDLLQVAGLMHDAALRAVPPMPRRVSRDDLEAPR